MDFGEYFRASMEDPEARQLYREVLEEEFRNLLQALGLGEGDLSLPLLELARLARAKGLSLTRTLQPKKRAWALPRP